MFTSKLPFRIGTILIVLMLALGSVQPVYATPSNDNFADATVISSLPFYAYDNNYGATFETYEPNPSCRNGGFTPSTIWYAYTPSTNISLTAHSDWWDYPPVLAIYTGSLGSLTELFCVSFGGQVTFQAQRGVTYYFQLSTWSDDEWYQSTLPFFLEVTPPPYVSMYFDPWDPSIFDNIWFEADIWDPVEIYGGTPAWDLGDGTTSNQYSFTHQYAKDGDYTVSLTYTTDDGRTGNDKTTIQVRTRDVAITKLTVPKTAKVNTTKEITVEVANRRYSDNVQVKLYKGLPGGGEQLIGTLTIYVPARANRATLFKFSYTFTGCDAELGKATFRTTATLMSGRDALPADNTAIRTTLVNGSGTCSPNSYP